MTGVSLKYLSRAISPYSLVVDFLLGFSSSSDSIFSLLQILALVDREQTLMSFTSGSDFGFKLFVFLLPCSYVRFVCFSLLGFVFNHCL